ncbi:MAG: polysaccharide/polyol phosphate ABC transporter ATP-binding protein [Gallionellales bacterium RBG_16_57_15]|nr:MAG: polysaccharide/polyol phosphate ABC transporter ATP-binding protein [Gallionellales bacterium RBG_16_57_15]
MSIIEVNHLTKEYRLGAVHGLKEILLNTGARLIGKKKVPERPLFKALDDVSFSIEQGEVVGIIGHNGAGKSTLLKMLSKISTPTRGTVKIEGRIAPLIEVGAGFVPDLTGRENVYLNGAILGMPRHEIDRKFDEIVDFAEMEEFIDTPVKRYSTGMQVKLAFSVATSIESEILIVDEVLAVGDVAFQRKCIGRMETLINTQGRTVLLVGHNIRQLERICSRMLLMKHGRLECDGEPGKVSKLFLDDTTLKPEHGSLDLSLQPTINTGDIEVISIEVVTDEHVDGTPVCKLFDNLHIQVRINVLIPQKNAEITIGLHTPEMTFLTKSNTAALGHAVNLDKGIHTLNITIDHLPLCPGTFGIGLAIHNWMRHPLWMGNRLSWIMIESQPDITQKLPPGTMTYLPTHWAINAEQPEPTAP